MIQLSHAAAHEIRRLKSKYHSNVSLRLAVKPGGCDGWYYDMSFHEALYPSDRADFLLRSHLNNDEAKRSLQKGDRIFDSQGLQVVIDTESLKYINGLTLDYSEDLVGGGFRFYNPQAISTCECGNSFSITIEQSA